LIVHELTDWSSGTGLKGDVWRNTNVVSPGHGRVLTKRREDHEEALAERGCDFALVETADLDEVAFREVDTNLLPCLTESSV
jgi:hypothetical protein